MKFGKLIGGGLGWALGGPLGGVLGYLMGAALDNLTEAFNVKTHPENGEEKTMRGDFMVSLVVLSAAIIKADRKVLESEKEYVRQFFIRQFGEEAGNDGFKMLNDVLRQQFQIDPVANQVGKMLNHASRLQMLHYLFGIANADNNVHQFEVDEIERISRIMGISQADFASIRSMFVKNSFNAYQILGVEPSASDNEVKAAYRRKAVENHPDKVAYLGADVQAAAKEKFQKIQEAYEAIKKERGLN